MSYDIDYLTLLSQQYPTVKAASTEIIRLQSRQKLPKLTEHFMSDIHGEYESFLHILKNASGVIKDKITQIYGRTLSERDRQVLATLIYYPEQKLEYIKDEVDDINDWYKITLYRLIEICRVVASKYTRAKIREFLPEAFGSTIDELIPITARTRNHIITNLFQQSLNSGKPMILLWKFQRLSKRLQSVVCIL